MTDQHDWEPRDRTFTPALEAQEARERAAEHRAAGRVDEWDRRKDEERARNASTDPRWDAKNGGLPERKIVSADDALRADEQSQHTVVPLVLNSAPATGFAFENLYLADGRVIPLGPQSDGSAEIKASTIDPPTADPLSPYTRSDLMRILTDLDDARERLRKLLERAP